MMAYYVRLTGYAVGIGLVFAVDFLFPWCAAAVGLPVVGCQ